MTITKIALTFAASAAVALADGAESYAKACKSCHGADGTPNAGVAKMMKVEMKHLGDPAVQGLPADKWKSIVTEGTGKMKGVKSIEGKQVDDAIAFAKTFKK